MAPKNADKAGASIWLVPAALEGAKSRKRAIFKIDEVKAESGDKVIHISGVALSLESRVAAVAEAGRTITSLLLSEAEATSGEAWHHKGLSVVHLGPHLAKNDGDDVPTQEQHMAAVAIALRSKPQVVVLDEACAAGGVAWTRTFAELLQSEGLQSFKGAVVVCSHDETFAVRRVCDQRWSAVADTVTQEEITGRQLDVFVDVVPAYRAAQAAEAENSGKKKGGKKSADAGQSFEEIAALVEEARALSEYCFEEDVLKESRRQGYTVSLLTEATQDGARSLRGYITYKTYTSPDGAPYVYIARLAVPRKCRKLGYGPKLVKWLLSETARLPKSECSSITCSALNSVVPFYTRLGFVSLQANQPAWKAEEEEDPEDPQTWMELPNNSLV